MQGFWDEGTSAERFHVGGVDGNCEPLSLEGLARDQITPIPSLDLSTQ